MHSALSIASLLLAASGALARPQAAANTTSTDEVSASSYGGSDTEVRVILTSQATETGSQTVFNNVNTRRTKTPVGSTGPFETIEISVGADAQQDLRCKALGLDGKPLVATRGANTDITFSDADKGAWTFQGDAEVSKIVCDPTFVAAAPEDFQVRVQLASAADDLATQTVFEAFEERAALPPTGTVGPFDTVEILVGKLIDPALRCALKNGNGRRITATRGENIDTTFSDADKGEWTFDRPRQVSQIICDPAFVAMPQ